MEKENNKFIIITKAIEGQIKNKKIKLQNNHKYKNPQTLINTLVNINKKTKVKIYDVTFIKSKKQYDKNKVSNHINKTGKNPLRKNKKNTKIEFVDITKIYSNTTKDGIITTGLGTRYEKHKRKQKNPSTELINIAIICKTLKFKNIQGVLINIKN